MAALTGATSPVIRLRDNWMVIDPAVARRARRRVSGPGRTKELAPVVALQAALTGKLDLDGGAMEVHPGATLEKVRDRIVDASVVAPLDPPAGLAATLRDYQRHGLTWLAELTGVGLGACLADDMGLGKTVTLIALHLHRRAARARAGTDARGLPGLPDGQLGGARSGGSPPASPYAASTAPRATLDGLGDGFVLTTYGTMRLDHETLAAVPWDLVVADEAQHIKNPKSSTARNLRTIPSRCRVALTGTPVENNLTELWAILDWATPGLLGSRNAFRKVWAAPIESGVDPLGRAARSPSWSSRSCCAVASPTPASRPSCRRRPRPTSASGSPASRSSSTRRWCASRWSGSSTPTRRPAAAWCSRC